MTDSLSVDKLPDRVSRPCKQLFDGVKNTIVEVEKTMLQIMPDKMQAQFMRVCSLSAMITKVPNECLITVFTNDRMVPVGHECCLLYLPLGYKLAMLVIIENRATNYS